MNCKIGLQVLKCYANMQIFFDITTDYLLGRTDWSVSVRHMKGKPGVVSSKLISLIVELFLCIQDDFNLEINLEQLRQR